MICSNKPKAEKKPRSYWQKNRRRWRSYSKSVEGLRIWKHWIWKRKGLTWLGRGKIPLSEYALES